MQKFTLLVLLWTVSACASTSSREFVFSDLYKTGDTYMGIRLRGTLELAKTTINGLKLQELSGLAWDEDEKLLYAVSDKGFLFHLRPKIVENTLVDVKILAAYLLCDKVGKPLQGYWTDSEGLAIVNGNNGIKGDSKLLISFEGKPRIAWYFPNGKLIKYETLPKALQNPKDYAGYNKALESVTLHPRWGILTTPEYPLKKQDSSKVVLYALNGKTWTLPRHAAPGSAVVALETLEDGSILLLERAFVSVAQPLIITLRRVWLSKTKGGHNNVVREVAVFNNTQGWRLDNFEGLTQQRGNYFFMVSDDNNSIFQRTLLVYFEMLP